MLVAISSSENDLNSVVDLRFGRTKGFIIYDTETKNSNYIDNVQNLEAAQGAGIQAAQNVINTDAKAVITGHCGPKAFKMLSDFDVKIYAVENEKISDAIEKLEKNELKELTSADVSGHWM